MVFQEGYQFRSKGIHHIHMSSIVTTAFNMFKSLMKEKMRKRVSNL